MTKDYTQSLSNFVFWRTVSSISFEQQPEPLLIGGFGYGRRQVEVSYNFLAKLLHYSLCRNCPGRYLALNTAWIAIASILATSNINKAVDENGHILEPLIAATDGLVRYVWPRPNIRSALTIFTQSHPKLYKVQFNPRFDGVHVLIESAKASISWKRSAPACPGKWEKYITIFWVTRRSLEA